MKLAPIAISMAAIQIASVAPASAIQFLNTGAVQSYVIPSSGYYSFVVAGAQGGIGDAGIGGGGAIISGKLYFGEGTALSLLIGAGGGSSYNGDSAGGGGGMSFIAAGATPLIVAGGGAGAAWFYGSHGNDAYIGPSGSGQGGVGLGSGAGWYSAGGAGLAPTFDMGSGGLSGPSYAGGQPNVAFSDSTPLPDGTEHPPYLYTNPGGAGGFGGGGGGGFNCGGSGAGFTGGDSCGFGGSSYISMAALDVVAAAGANKGPLYLRYGTYSSASADGFITIVQSAVPEPAAWTMLILGFGAIGFMLRQRPKGMGSELSPP